MSRNCYDEYQMLSQEQKKAVWLKLEGSEVSGRELRDIHDECLNECFGTVSICGYEYEPARALAAIDPVAYRESFNDWLGTSEDYVELCGETKDEEGRTRIVERYFSVSDVFDAINAEPAEENEA